MNEPGSESCYVQWDEGYLNSLDAAEDGRFIHWQLYLGRVVTLASLRIISTAMDMC